MTKSRFAISKGALVVWIISYLFFLVTLVNNFSASHDSIHYLNDIVKSTNLFHQHHLLYHFLANKWLVFWQGFFSCGNYRSLGEVMNAGGGRLFCQPHYLIESFTALWGSSALTMVYLFLRKRFYLTRSAAWLGTAVVACSYGVWFYSVNIEVYLPPLFFILWCLFILTKKEFAKTDIWKIAILHSLAILFHQVNILFTLVVLYSLIRNKFYASLLTYAVLGIIITGGMYFITGWFIEGHNTVAAWVGWMQGYTVGHDYWQPLSAKTPLHVVTGFGHAFIGGHYIFQLPAAVYYLHNSFQSHGLKDEIFLSSKISSSTAWILSGLTVLFATLLLTLIIKFIFKCRSMKLHYPVISPLLITLIVYSAFFCFWMPEILEFWILQMVIVWLLLIGMMPILHFPFRLQMNTGLMIVAVLLFVINYFGSIYWLQRPGRDWYYAETKIISQSVSPGDLIIVCL
ncbi:MAG: hypothetical protein J7497_12715, partial [Chitinophagaceae bacterium]|nr:hypothetical protein [Chitinophagaceae bacterium]